MPAIGPERLEPSTLRLLGLHQHAGGGAIGQLRGVAGRDEAALLHALPVLEHGLQLLEVLEPGLRPISLVLVERDLAG
jgi:hypothetical protein